MSLLAEIRSRFAPALEAVVADPAERQTLLGMIRPAQDPRFGDYQANFAMGLGKQLGRPPRDVAQQMVASTNLADLCSKVEVAGPGFVNLTINDHWLRDQLVRAAPDERLNVPPVTAPRTYVVDYSSPNVAKPMHVGHIRSTVIGAALDRILRFVGHRVISDNHLGDWGTQFGMIIYGYKHFGDRAAYEKQPLAELLRIYRLVHTLVGYFEGKAELPVREEKLRAKHKSIELLRAQQPSDKKERDRVAKQIDKQLKSLEEEACELEGLRAGLTAFEQDARLSALAAQHAAIGQAVLAETAKLHQGDAENLKLWREFLPACRQDIQKIYDRLDVKFDYELGESFYHDQLADVVADLEARGLAKESEGATCVFLAGFETPMIVRKKDGAFLYSTTDLATIKYRMDHWRPDAALYVVDHRQSEHFEKLFAAARLWGYKDIELQHISFGTILGDDGKPYKTRSGDTVGLEGLLDEAVSRALAVVRENDRERTLSEADARRVAEVVGIGALKYADLSQNRTSDYTFSYDKMLAMNGNTATYMQYSYARVQSIFRKGNTTPAAVRGHATELTLADPAERALALELVRFREALDDVLVDYRPNVLTNYLFELAKKYSTFFEECPVLKAETESLRASRLVLCDLVARTLRTGLELLGIQTVEKM